MEGVKSAVIRHGKHGYRVCNICQDAELGYDNENGVCTPCADYRVEDGIWTQEQRDDPLLRTDDSGEIIINK